MTEKEAIEILRSAISESEKVIAQLSQMKELAERKNRVGEYYSNIQNCRNEIESCKIAVKALEEIQPCREAAEKQEAKKPKDELRIKPVLDENGAYVDADTTVYLICPVCGEVVGIDDMCDRFCRECGQAIDGSEEE
mgnify:CR=1 FL=1